MIEVQNHSNSLRQDISPKTTCKHFFSIIKNIDQEMNHSEEFGRVTWAGANMPTSQTLYQNKPKCYDELAIGRDGVLMSSQGYPGHAQAAALCLEKTPKVSR